MIIKGKKIYAVTWNDSSRMREAWIDEEDIILDLLPCISVGWLWKKTKDNIILVRDFSNYQEGIITGQLGSVLSIPQKNVINMIELKELK